MTTDLLDRSAGTDALVPRPFVVRRRIRETSDTTTLLLEPVDRTGLEFEPGQFTMIGRPGFGEVPISISGDSARPGMLEHTVRAVGDASAAIARTRRGDTLLVRGPYGRGWDVEAAAGHDVLVVAGGIGLAPLRPVVLDVLARRDLFRRAFLVVGSRTPDQLLYPRQMEQWRGRFDVDVDVTVDAADAGWRGHVGVVTDRLPRLDLDPLSTFAFLCGPEVMMRVTADALCALGVPAAQVRVSMERNMKCGVGMCGHCQLRELFVCLDGPVFGYDVVQRLMTEPEL
ncbi:MAG TPA: FAD/NAD(P)-binding protein [Mycobacteriales bacterium]|nr:FAD/NAD(P)-binding protein [Mycobacteriales bacterium]